MRNGAERAAALSDAEKLCTLAAGVFFTTALLTGVWKWRSMATSKSGTAPKYVDTAHRASLLDSSLPRCLHAATAPAAKERGLVGCKPREAAGSY